MISMLYYFQLMYVCVIFLLQNAKPNNCQKYPLLGKEGVGDIFTLSRDLVSILTKANFIDRNQIWYESLYSHSLEVKSVETVSDVSAISCFLRISDRLNRFANFFCNNFASRIYHDEVIHRKKSLRQWSQNFHWKTNCKTIPIVKRT